MGKKGNSVVIGKNKQPVEIQFIKKTELKERGWTETIIKKFCPEPDAIKDNPVYRSAAPMKLYDIERVEKAERSTEFKELMKKSEIRKRAAKRAVLSKKAKLMEYINRMVINVPKLKKCELVQQACKHYNNHQSNKEYRRNQYGTLQAGANDDTQFLNRITVNYIRHCLADYEYNLCQIFGKVGKEEAYQAL
ncbi:MAG: hypothetical protein ACUZ8O_08815, partial [Candidatus Anammoxibacter sp.]